MYWECAMPALLIIKMAAELYHFWSCFKDFK